MKAKPSSKILLVIGLSVLALIWQTAKAQSKEEDALLEVMKAKSKVYFDGNVKGWIPYWVQDSSSSRTVIHRDGYSNQVGWSSIIAQLAKDSKQVGIRKVAISYKNIHFRLTERMAFVEADEYIKLLDGEPPLEVPVHTYTVLLKKGNSWKIANQVRVDADTFSKTPSNRENDLNTLGYELLNEKRIDEAVKIFIVNVQLNPTSWNAYDSLGEAYALSGNTKLAIVNYEKSLELNPKNEAGRKNLERLKKR